MTPALANVLGTSDGRVVIVAMDHGLSGGVVPGIEAPLAMLETILDAGPDGVLLSAGLARHATAAIRARRAALWVTMDYHGTTTVPGAKGDDEIHALVATPAMAADLGASGVKVVLVFGYKLGAVYAQNLRAVATVVEAAHRLRLPVMVEAVLWGQLLYEEHRDDPSMLAHACRIAMELGADVLKTQVPSGGLAGIAASLPVPIVMLGGPSGKAPDTFLAAVAGAMGDGARGVVAGRAVWQAQTPAAVIASLRAIVHGGPPAAQGVSR